MNSRPCSPLTRNSLAAVAGLLALHDPLSARGQGALTLTPRVPLFTEPANAVTNALVSVTCGVPAPVDIRLTFRSVAGGTATPGTDYRPVEGTLIIPAGSTEASFGVPVFPDRAVEGAETIHLELGAPDFGTLAPSANPVVLTVAEAPPEVTGTYDQSFPEPSSGEAVYTVPFRLRRGPTPVDLPVRYRIAPLTATAADALLTEEGTVTIPAGSVTAAIPLTVYADSLVEEPETVVVSLTGAGPFSQNLVWVAVTIDDQPLPGTEPDFFTARQNTTLPAAPERNVLANDTAGHTLIAASRRPRHGTVTWGTDGTFSYTPFRNFIGTDRFAYTSLSLSPPADHPWKWLHPLDGKDPELTTPGFTADWMKPGFDDTAWKNGAGLMGYGIIGPDPGVTIDTDIGTPPSGLRYTAYFRTKITLPTAPGPGVTISFSCDDAPIFYLNGVEIGRWAQPGVGPFATAPDTHRLTAGENTLHAEEETRVRHLWFPDAQLLQGENTLAVSLHNNTDDSSDLGMRILRISPDRISSAVYVTVDVQDSGSPPVVVDDTVEPPPPPGFPGNAPLLDSRLVSGIFLTSGSVYDGDGLLAENGVAYDPILSVFIDGSPAGPVTFDRDTGHWTMDAPPGFFGTTFFTYRVRDKDGWSNTATVTVTVDPTRPYDIWRAERFRTDSAGIWGLPERDEDGDGVVNLMEYILGRDAMRADAVDPLRISRGEGGAWTAEFEVAPGFGADAGLALESSSTLAPGNWTRIARLDDFLMGVTEAAPGVSHTRTLVPLDTVPPTERARYRFTVPGDSSPRRWFRLRALQEKTVLDP